MVLWQKPLTIPSWSKSYHRSGLDRVLDIYVVHPGRLTADIWGRICPWGASEDLRGPQKGASGAETGTFGVSRNVVDAPEVLGRPWEPKRLWLVYLGEPH